ncbi:MAG: archease [Candidatus Thorarchaeota archaeon]|nr:archease [Candidatus Thorarchaeota archaeon]
MNELRGFRFHEHTADITIECWAPTLAEAFEEAAFASFNVIVDTSTVDAKDKIDIHVEGIDLQELLVEWVGQLIALIDIHGQFYSKFQVRSIRSGDPWTLDATIWGEAIDFDKHDVHTEVKAMTYADMKIEESSDKVTLWFTLDL